jgi:hypothetical protein
MHGTMQGPKPITSSMKQVGQGDGRKKSGRNFDYKHQKKSASSNDKSRNNINNLIQVEMW